MASFTEPDEEFFRDAFDRSSDEALLRVIELIDTLPSRPERIEAIVSVSRPRLRSLRPGRALNYARLLFLPVEGAICAGETWMPGEPAIPRRTLSPILAALRDAMGPITAEIDASLAENGAAEPEAVQQTALRLWSNAARLAPSLAWRDADAAAREEREAVVGLCAAVWSHAPRIWPVLSVASGDAPDDALRHAIAAPRHNPAAATVLILTLIARASMPGRVASLARAVAPGMRSHIEHALDQWIERSARAMAEAGAQREGDLVENFAAAIDDMDQRGWLKCPERRRRAQDAAGALPALASSEGVRLSRAAMR